MEHLELGRLTPFAARYFITEAVMYGGSKSEVERTVLSGIRQAADEISKQLDLTDHFDYLVVSIETYRERFSNEISREFDEALTRVVEALTQHDCERCDGVKACDRCTHGASTFDNVDKWNGGRCIKPVKRLFRQLQYWVQINLRELPESTKAPKMKVTLATINWNFHNEREIVQKFSIGGYALTYPSGDSFATKVSLAIREKSFEWQQFCVLPYVLLHEIVCHAYQSLDSPGVREDAHPADAWSEGWMDRLAYELAIEWIARRRKRLRLTAPALDMAKQHIRQLHDFRYRLTDLQPPSEDVVKSLPEDGREGFIQVLDCYPPPYREMRVSSHPLTRFSLRLNAITLDRKFRVGRVLQTFKYLSEHDPARLREVVGAFNAELHDNVAVENLERALS